MYTKQSKGQKQHDASLGDRPRVMLASCKGKREADNNGQYQQVASVASIPTNKWHHWQQTSGIIGNQQVASSGNSSQFSQ